MTDTRAKLHLCIDCRKEPPATVRKLWAGLKDGDPPRCGEHGRAWRDRRRRQASEARIRRMGIEPELYWWIYERQGSKCAMPRCTANGKVKLLAIEHNHEQAILDGHAEDKVCENCIRGLMCGPHNYELIGKYRNSLQDALDYLADPPARRFVAEYRAAATGGPPWEIPGLLVPGQVAQLVEPPIAIPHELLG